MAEAPNETIAGKQAVLEKMSEHPAVKALAAWDPAALIDALFDRGELSLTVPPESIIPAVNAIKNAGYNAFEDMTAVRLRYADSVIADRNRRIAAVGADVDVDFSTVRRVFDRVADQILQNPLDAALVVIDHHRLS